MTGLVVLDLVCPSGRPTAANRLIVNHISGKVYTKKGRRAVCTVTGSHGKAIVYGLQTMDGRSMCAQYDRFTKEDFAKNTKRTAVAR